ncbi:MAG: GntR family transcriptional regulator, partial [Chloroflexi bacterium]|nr:GntR family transcriptional regulator [Chloroflexota bacterium]
MSRADRSLLSAQVVREIRRAILSGALPPGARVVEAEIAQQMGISRSPVREAMVQLEHEGLITRHP